MATCSWCNSKASEGDEYCRNCGESLEIVTCSGCSSVISAADKFCWKCGAELEEEQAVASQPVR